MSDRYQTDVDSRVFDIWVQVMGFRLFSAKYWPKPIYRTQVTVAFITVCITRTQCVKDKAIICISLYLKWYISAWINNRVPQIYWGEISYTYHTYIYMYHPLVCARIRQCVTIALTNGGIVHWHIYAWQDFDEWRLAHICRGKLSPIVLVWFSTWTNGRDWSVTMWCLWNCCIRYVCCFIWYVT